MKNTRWRYRVKFYWLDGSVWGTLLYNSMKEVKKQIATARKRGEKALYAGRFK